MANQKFVELRWIFSVIRRWWWLITGLAILAAAAAYVATSILPPVYECSAMLLVNPARSSSTSQYNDLMAGTQLALTYSQMVKDRPVLEAVIAKLGLKQSAGDLADQITAEPVRNSQIIKLTVTGSDPRQIALIANTLAEAFTARVQELSTLRYAVEIKGEKDRIDTLQAQIKDMQAQMDTLRFEKAAKDAALSNRQTSLTSLQNDDHTLKNSYQALQLTLAEITGSVYIVEPVQVQTDTILKTSSATAVVSIGQVQSLGANSLADSRLALTYGQLIMKPSLLQGVINDLNLNETTGELSKKISFDVVTGTQLIRFTVVDAEEARAQAIAQALVDAFLTQVEDMLIQPYADRLKSMQTELKDMEAQINTTQDEIGTLSSQIAQLSASLERIQTDLDSVRSDYRDALQNYQRLQTTSVQESDAVIITEPAQPPKSPRQNRILYVAMAGFIGLSLGGVLAFILKNFDGKIYTEHDVRSLLNLPVLTSIGQLSRSEKDLVMGYAPHSRVAEDFRVLSYKVRLMHENSSLRTLLITSPLPSEGKSLTASNLAIGLTKMGLRVALVDADMRLPRLHTLFDLDHECGLSDSLSAGALNGSMKATLIDQLQIMTSGSIPTNPAELLSSSNMVNLLDDLKKRADIVLIDCAPVLVVSDAFILASKVDGVLLVLRAGSSESSAARDAAAALLQVRANLIGTVLNSVVEQRRGYSYHRVGRQTMIKEPLRKPEE